MHFVVFIQIWISHLLNYLRNMFALLSSLYVSSDSIIMSQIQICVTANQKWMLTRDIFLPYVLCTFSFLFMVFISNFEVLEEWCFFFQISSLINLISMYFYTYLVKYSPYFVLSSTYFIFFFVLSSILCKIEFSTLLDPCPCFVATVLGAWALCRILTHVDNRVYQGFLFGSLPGCHCMLSLLSVSATCCVILSQLLIWVTNFPSTHLIHLWSLFWNKKNPLYDFCICIMHNLFIIIINIKRTIILLNNWILLFFSLINY